LAPAFVSSRLITLIMLRSSEFIGCPLTTSLHPNWRSRLSVRCAGKPAEVAVDQIRTISTLRLTKKTDVLSAEKATRLRELIVEMYGLP